MSCRSRGRRASLRRAFSPDLQIARENGTLAVSRPSDAREHRSLHGLTRTLINNMVVGVTDGFRKNLEIQGVGYRAAMDGKDLVLNVGYSHPVRMTPPEGVTYRARWPDQDRGHRARQAGRRRRSRAHPPRASAGTLQGQGHSLRRRSRPPQGR